MATDPTTASAPTGRRARKKAETRARIFEAAVALFLRDGYHGVTIEQICEAADVANGTFFLHFPTKPDLLVEFSTQLNDRITARMENATGTAEEKLRALRLAMVSEWEAHSAFMRDMVRELMARQNPDLTARTANTLHALATQLIEEGQRAGDFSKDFPAALVATTILSGWNGITISWSKTGDWDQAREANKAVLNLVLRGLKA